MMPRIQLGQIERNENQASYCSLFIYSLDGVTFTLNTTSFLFSNISASSSSSRLNTFLSPTSFIRITPPWTRPCFSSFILCLEYTAAAVMKPTKIPLKSRIRLLGSKILMVPMASRVEKNDVSPAHRASWFLFFIIDLRTAACRRSTFGRLRCPSLSRAKFSLWRVVVCQRLLPKPVMDHDCRR